MSDTTQKNTKKKETSWPRLILWAGILLIIFAIGQKVWRVYSHATSLLEHQAIAETLLTDGWQQADVNQLVTLTHDVRHEISGLIKEARPFLPITPYLEWLPRIGPIMPYAETLLNLADDGTTLAVLLVDGLHPAISTMQQQDTDLMTKLPSLLNTISDAEANLLEADPLLAQILEDYEIIRSSPELMSLLPASITQRLDEIDPLLPFAHDLLKLAPAVPELAGHNKPVTYLFAAQNSDELRPTGGFMSAVAKVSIDNGQIGSLDFQDSYALDDFNKPYDFPPQPLYDYMGSELFVLRDSNFWPHFPTSAEKMMELYTYTTEVELDGVITIDLQLLELLVIALQPIQVPEINATLTEENLYDVIYQAWETGEASQVEDGIGEWWLTRKSFMGPVAQGIRTKLEQDFGSIDLIKLAQAIQLGAQGKNFQIYTRNNDVYQVLEEIHWAGTMFAPTQSDTLSLIETNVGFTKVNPIIERQVVYSVELQPDNTGTAQLDLTYNHTGNLSTVPCTTKIVTYSDGVTYDEVSDACYRNYFRVLSPAESVLESGTSHPYSGEYFFNHMAKEGLFKQEVDTITNHTVFSNMLIVPHQETITTSLTYELPQVVFDSIEGNFVYRLKLYKQAGAKAYPLTLQLTLPEGSQFISSSQTPSIIDEQFVTFELIIDQDQEIYVNFQP